MASKAPGERFVVELRALPSSYSAISRLKRFLKSSLRIYGLKAERVEQLPDGPAPGLGGGDAGAEEESPSSEGR
jgi:hypothetical protein